MSEQSDALWASVNALLEAVQPMRDELKRCCMIYQYEEKFAAAQAWNKSVSYFDVEYKRWARYRTLLHRKQAAASEACSRAGIPPTMPYCDFPLYRELMGLDRKVLK